MVDSNFRKIMKIASESIAAELRGDRITRIFRRVDDVIDILEAGYVDGVIKQLEKIKKL